MELTEEEIHINCSYCSNKRLLDCGESAEGIIKIKCPCCKVVSVINLKHVTEKQRIEELQHTKKQLKII